MTEYHLSDGTTLIDALLPEEADRNSVRIIDAGLIDEDKVVDFEQAGCYKCLAASGVFTLDVTSLGVGQSGLVHIIPVSLAPTLTFVGVDIWLNSTAPTFTSNMSTVVRLFNDGTNIVGSFLEEPSVL